MKTFEKENEKQEKQKRKREDLTKENGLPARGKTSENRQVEDLVDKQPGQTYSDKCKNNIEQDETIEKLKFKSAWAQQMSQVSLENQLKLATEEAERLEEKNEAITRKPAMEKKPLKLGNSLDRHQEADWAWNQGDEDWDGTINKAEKNKEKKQKEKEIKEKKIRKAALLGRYTIGVGPIMPESITYFNNITADYEEAKRMAGAEFLTEYLKFNHEDMQDLEITDTRISQKGDNVLYLVLDSPEKVVNIRRRLADIQNHDIITCDFIPPQFYDRYRALSSHAKELRNNNSQLKTQIRFEELDIELYTKEKGTDGPFQPMGITALQDQLDLPRIDHTIQWKRKTEKQHWRSVSPKSGLVQLKSLGGKVATKQPQKQTDEPAAKKSKRKLAADSSLSDNSGESPAKRKDSDLMNTSN